MDSCFDVAGSMMEFSKHMKALGELLFELLSEALGLNSSHLKDIDCAKSQVMFCQYYPPCPQPDLTLGLSKHTDFSYSQSYFRTILEGFKFSMTKPGLMSLLSLELLSQTWEIFSSTFMKANPLSEENPAKYRELTINEFADIFRSKTISTPSLHQFRI
ncbi:hypothetical protein F2Q70_00019273 [Brassica cretica]|uniref:Isopenicillin N synthase-like Fe(2+) 2OG dioxygenase domain-containing protein n=1 Tax=Brassica cretica TaxID=69181 RepID=A0A8S9GS98_BRACR|nr:hypothetical protein F2Q70_00019273 [Brassica cretica]